MINKSSIGCQLCIQLSLGMVTAMDEGIGEIVKALKANSLYDDTIFMLIPRSGGSTDQGGSNWPLR